MKRRDFLQATGASAILLPLAGRAQVFPSRPIRMVVPLAAGAGGDSVARTLGNHMARTLGQPVVIENKPGANTTIGVMAMLNSPADGHAFLLATDSTLVLNNLLYRELQYDSRRDLAPIGWVVETPMLLYTGMNSGLSSVQGLVERARREPDRLTFASSGNGSMPHLAGELFAVQAGIRMLHVPFTGAAAAIQSVVSGQVDLIFGTVPSGRQLIGSGRARGLAVLGAQPDASLPGVPTLKDSGYEPMQPQRLGLVASRKAPPEVIERLNRALNEALADPAFQARLSGEGYVLPAPHAPDSMAKQIDADRQRWAGVVQKRNIRLD